MAAATLSTIEALLKEVYEGRLEDQLNEEVTALKRIERTSDGVVETVGGKYVDFPIRVGRNTGIGYRQESEQLPDAGKQQYAEVHVGLKYGYGRGEITNQAIDLADKNYQAFASALDTEMDTLKSDTVKDQNRIVYGDGTGLLASITADGVADNTITVDTVQYLGIGMKIDIRKRSDGAVTLGATSRLITAINRATKLVTYDGADVDPDNTYGLYRAGNYASGTSREPTGFARIIDDDTILHTVDPATQPEWAAYVDAPANPRALSEGLMIAACDEVRTRGGGKVSVIFGSLGVRRAYFSLLSQQRRYSNTKEFAGGFTGLAFNYGTEIPMVEDVDAPASNMWFVDESKIRIYRNKPWHWLDREGHVLKWVRDFDNYEYLLRQYSEMGTSERNAHARLTNIIEG